MKKFLILVSVILTGLQGCKEDEAALINFNGSGSPGVINKALSGWTQVASFPAGGRIGAFGFSIGNKGYVGAGAASSSQPADFWEYDAENNSWTRKPDFPGGNRSYAISFTIGNKGYVGLGLGTGANGNQFIHDLWEFDPATNAWTQKADFPATPYASNASVAFRIGNRGYVGISCGDFQLYEYNSDTDRWTKKASFPGGNRFGSVGFSIKGKGYIGLGITRSGGSNVTLADIWEYDPATNSWLRKADFPGGPRGQAVAFSIQDKGYISSGLAEYGNYQTGLRNDTWEYDPTDDTWELQDLTEYPARAEAVGFSIGNAGFIGTGINLTGNNYQSDFWKFTVE